MTSTTDGPLAIEVPAPRGAQNRSGFSRLLPATRAQTAIGLLALMFLAGSFGYFIGVRNAGVASPPEGSADIGFLYDMSAHHQQAVKLSMIELANGSDPSVQVFAREIIRSQSYEIGLMQMRLGNWGFDPAERPQEPMAWMGMSLPTTDSMPGMADDSELQALREASGATVDALFLALMSDHHAGGVAMAQAAADSASDEWVVDTAGRMASIQASEIVEMNFAREAAGLTARPPGFTPDFSSDRDQTADMDMGESPDGE